MRRAALLILLVACEAPEVIPRDTPQAAAPAARPEAPELLRRVDAMKSELRARQDKPITVMVALGNLYYQSGRYPDAIDWYRQALEAAAPLVPQLAPVEGPLPEPGAACDPGTDEARFLAAIEHARSLEGPAARACWREALAPITGAHARRGGAWSMLDQPQLARADLERALLIDPDAPEALYLLGAIVFQSATARPPPEALDQARAAWRRFLEVAPEHPRATDIRGALEELDRMMSAGASAPSIAMPTTAAGLPPALAEAERRLAGGDANGALSIYDQFLAMAPGHAAALTGKGRALIALGRGREAGPVLRAAIAAGRTGRALVALGEWYARVAGQPDEAEKLWREAWEVDPDYARAAGIEAP